MRIQILRIIFIFTALLAQACADLKVQRAENAPTVSEATEIETRSYIFGFVPSGRIFQADLCPKSRIETMRLHMTNGDVGLALLTLGIYVPQHLSVGCAKN